MNIDSLQKLDRLQSLRSSGALSEEEFEAQKAKLLRRPAYWTLLAAVASVGLVVAGAAQFGRHARDPVATSSATTSQNDQAAPAVAPAAVGQLPFSVSSHVAGSSLVKVAQLPLLSPSVASQDDCRDYIKPTSTGGRLAAGRGWHVVEEKKIGELDAVLIMSGTERGTTGQCEAKDANIAFFDESRLVGVLSARGIEPVDISHMQKIGGSIRVWSAIPESAQGQINLNDRQLTFDAIRGNDFFCGGKYHVPTRVLGESYDKARRVLMGASWLPQDQRNGPDDVMADTPTAKYKEAEMCSGIGFGLCSFSYKSASGPARLTVTTYGDEGVDAANVAYYQASCDGSPSDEPWWVDQ